MEQPRSDCAGADLRAVGKLGLSDVVVMQQDLDVLLILITSVGTRVRGCTWTAWHHASGMPMCPFLLEASLLCVLAGAVLAICGPSQLRQLPVLFSNVPLRRVDGACQPGVADP